MKKDKRKNFFLLGLSFIFGILSYWFQNYQEFSHLILWIVFIVDVCLGAILLISRFFIGRQQKEEKKLFQHNLEFYFFFGIVLTTTLAVPHLLHGHILISERYSPLVIMFLNLGLAYLFYFIYQRKIGIMKTDKKIYEKNLKEKDIFNVLLTNIIVSVAKANKGFLRFINRGSKKIIKEFYYNLNGNYSVNNPVKKKMTFVESDYQNWQIKCIFGFSGKSDGAVDYKLLKSLINQVHLLFVAVNSPYYLTANS